MSASLPHRQDQLAVAHQQSADLNHGDSSDQPTQEQQPTPLLPAWITELEDVHREALQKVQDAHKKGDDFQSGYHSGRAQVLQSWIKSAKVGRAQGK